jgi:hypothetical protein
LCSCKNTYCCCVCIFFIYINSIYARFLLFLLFTQPHLKIFYLGIILNVQNTRKARCQWLTSVILATWRGRDLEDRGLRPAPGK